MFYSVVQVIFSKHEPICTMKINFITRLQIPRYLHVVKSLFSIQKVFGPCTILKKLSQSINQYYSHQEQVNTVQTNVAPHPVAPQKGHVSPKHLKNKENKKMFKWPFCAETMTLSLF